MRNSHESVAKAAAFPSVDYAAASDPITPAMARVLAGHGHVGSDNALVNALRARLCFVAQAGSTVRWSPTLRKVVPPSRSALDVLEVHWGCSEAQTRRLLAQEFGMTFGGLDE